MNIKQARAIPIALVLKKMGAIPVRETEQEIRYLSPLRQERTASFHIHRGKNVWYDFGEGKGGSVIALVCAYLQATGECATVADALRWLRNMVGSPAPMDFQFPTDDHDIEKGWLLKSVKPIEHLALIRYLEQRGIPLPLAKRYLKEVHAQNRRSGKSIFALGFRNEEGGYELRNPFLKSAIAPKTVTFIRGSVPKPESIHLFEGFMDYLSAVTDYKEEQLEGDTIVLNSVACLQEALPYIKDYDYRNLYSWMDNNSTGENATQALARFVETEKNLLHQPMNDIYAPYEDVNAWRMHRLGLPLINPRPQG